VEFYRPETRRVWRMGGDVPIDDTSENCLKCKLPFNDIKNMIQCTSCKSCYRGKCENIDYRGFHLRRATWRCKRCLDTYGEDKEAGLQGHEKEVEWMITSIRVLWKK